MKCQLMFLVLLSVICSSCTRIAYHSYSKNYEIGREYTAYIGQPIIKINDNYCMSKPMYKYAESLDDFTVNGKYTRFGAFSDTSEIKAHKSKRYTITYVVDNDNEVYYVVFIPDSQGNTMYGLMIDKNGNIADSKFYLSGPGVKTVEDTKISPPFPHFSLIDKTECFGRLNGDENFELLYGGINNVMMSLTYREFTSDNLARPAFYQNLVYQTDAKQIRYKDFTILISDADNEKIKFKVVSEPVMVDSQFIPGTDEVFQRIQSRK